MLCVDKIYCANCGALAAENANFCWKCGAPLRGRDASVYRAQGPALNPTTQPSTEALKTYIDPAVVRKTVPKSHLDPAVIWLFFINYIGKTFLLVPPLAIGAYYQPIIGAGFGLYLLINYLIAVLVYNHFYFSIEEDRLLIEYGIIHKRHVTVPFRQVQNVNIISTLIDRILGIARLEVESAGSSQTYKREVVGGTRSKAEGFLPGLSIRRAREYHDLILQKARYARK
jgi:membrane protein YdbS with pleckstrin-like domain